MKKLLSIFLSLLITLSIGVNGVKADDEQLTNDENEDSYLIEENNYFEDEIIENIDDVTQDETKSTSNNEENGEYVYEIEESSENIQEPLLDEDLSIGVTNEEQTVEFNELLDATDHFTGLRLNSNDNNWYYYEDGEWISNAYKFIDYNGGKFLVANGIKVNEDGLFNDPNNDDDWYYLSNGQIQTQYTGLALYDGSWFYVDNGKLDTTFKGYVSYDNTLFLVGAGRLMLEESGLIEDPDNIGTWYYVGSGKVQTQYTGLADYANEWFYVKNGKLDDTYTGLVLYNGSWFFVLYGQFYNDVNGYAVCDGDLVYIYCGQPAYDIYAAIVNEQVNYTNNFRQEVGEEPLQLDIDLCMAAYKRSYEMAENNLLSHTRPNGTRCFTVLAEYGVSYGYAGENIAYGYDNAYDVSYGWKSSSGHYSNMIDTNFNRIGVGYENDEYGNTYWTQLFTD